MTEIELEKKFKSTILLLLLEPELNKEANKCLLIT